MGWALALGTALPEVKTAAQYKKHSVCGPLGQNLDLFKNAVYRGDVDGVALCRIFNKAIARMGTPKYLSTDHDPLFEFHRWKANLRILGVKEIITVSYVPLSHPFVERQIGTVRREFIDYTFFWNAVDLKRKLTDFKIYYNHHRAYSSLDGEMPAKIAGRAPKLQSSLKSFRWPTYCRGLYQLPVTA